MDLKITVCFIAAVTLFFGACTTDNDGGADNKEDQNANHWIYDSMKIHYLWNDEMPSSPSFGRDCDKFFESLLSDKDGKHNDRVDYYYSYIYKYANSTASTRAEEDYYKSTYGFDYILTQSYLYDEDISTNITDEYLKIYATIVYVTPGSPADSARLKRGDHIYRINGREFSRDGFNSLLAQLTAPVASYSSVTFTVCDLEFRKWISSVLEDTGETVNVPQVTRDDESVRDVTLTSAFMDQSPIYHYSVIEAGSHRVGYLVYNEFNSGGSRYTLTGETAVQGVYHSELRSVFQQFSGITDLVLDLRYNPGGEVQNCLLLASLIAPPSLTGQVFLTMEFNARTRSLTYPSEPYSVSLRRIYVLATGYSASASEALIHCLRGSGIEVYHIGSTTEGKNVGSTVFTTDDLNPDSQLVQNLGGLTYTAYPITFRIYDSRGETYSRDGLIPDYTIYEEFEVDFLPLGNREEPMLNAAVHHILTGAFPTRAAVGSRGQSVVNAVGPAIVPRNVKPGRGYIETGRY